jgi:hypothetical protein
VLTIRVLTIRVLTIRVLTIRVLTIRVLTIRVLTIRVLTIRVLTIRVLTIRVLTIRVLTSVLDSEVNYPHVSVNDAASCRFYFVLIPTTVADPTVHPNPTPHRITDVPSPGVMGRGPLVT